MHCTFLIFFCYFSSLSTLLQVFFYHIFSSVQHFTQNSFSDFIFTIPSCRSLYVIPLNLFPRQENNEIQHFFFYLFKFLLIFYLLVLLRAERGRLWFTSFFSFLLSITGPFCSFFYTHTHSNTQRTHTDFTFFHQLIDNWKLPKNRAHKRG